MWTKTLGRSAFWFAVLASISLHGAGLLTVKGRESAPGVAHKAMAVFITTPRMPTRAASALPLAPGKPRQRRLTDLARPRQGAAADQAGRADRQIDPDASPQPTQAAAASPVPPPASSADTSALLERITQGVLRADKARQAERAANKPWLSAIQPDAGRLAGHSNAAGGRTERVPSALGDYCVRLPNPATAYRSANGVNLAGAGNCP